MPRGTEPHLLVEVGIGVATCHAVSDPASQLRWAPRVPRAQWLWTPPPYWGGLWLWCRHVFYGFGPCLPIERARILSRTCGFLWVTGHKHKERLIHPSTIRITEPSVGQREVSPKLTEVSFFIGFGLTCIGLWPTKVFDES
jgi:hypothetical protein